MKNNIAFFNDYEDSDDANGVCSLNRFAGFSLASSTTIGDLAADLKSAVEAVEWDYSQHPSVQDLRADSQIDDNDIVQIIVTSHQSTAKKLLDRFVSLNGWSKFTSKRTTGAGDLIVYLCTGEAFWGTIEYHLPRPEIKTARGTATTLQASRAATATRPTAKSKG